MQKAELKMEEEVKAEKATMQAMQQIDEEFRNQKKARTMQSHQQQAPIPMADAKPDSTTPSGQGGNAIPTDMLKALK